MTHFVFDDLSVEQCTGQDNIYIMCRVELAKPDTDWERSWRLARLPGLGPENISFLFKMMHEILPTQERVSRTSPRASPACQAPGCGHGREDIPHALVLCGQNDGVGARLMACLRNCVPNLEVEAALRLEFDVAEEMELPLVWLVGTVGQAVWKLRADKSRVNLYEIRSQLEAKISLLRETRFESSAIILDQFVVDNFQ